MSSQTNDSHDPVKRHKYTNGKNAVWLRSRVYDERGLSGFTGEPFYAIYKR